MTPKTGLAAARELLGAAPYRGLFAQLRHALEQRGPEGRRAVTLHNLDADERRALADLLGSCSVPGPRVQVQLEKLDRALRESRVEAGLTDVLEALGGPLENRRAQRVRAQGEEQVLWAQASRHEALALHPELAPWLDELAARGHLARAATTSGKGKHELLEGALAACLRLPARGIPLSVLAAEVAGDAHALDPGQPLAALVLGAAARLAGWGGPVKTAGERRRLWSDVGVVCDPLSSQVLVLGLRPAGTAPLDRQLREWADLGEPRRLTLRETARSEFPIAAGTPCFVCENPGIVAAAADALGPRSQPLVCTEGVASTAVSTVLEKLARAGARLHFHADFDWPGLRVAGRLCAQFDAAPWRFGAKDYRSAAATSARALRLAGPSPPTPWDPALGSAMEEVGWAVFEEQCLAELLADLGG